MTNNETPSSNSDAAEIKAKPDTSMPVGVSTADRSQANTEFGDASERLPAVVDDGFDSVGFLKQVTKQAGVYQMFDGAGKILYVGKAKNLKNRLASYFRATGLAPKTRALVEKIRHVEVTVTATETEALLLEQNLIKQQRPPYNILLRDDKSYPYIMISRDDFPRLSLHRGGKRKGVEYHGPYPNVGAVKSSLNFLQKTFRIRQCEDSVYRNRTRPCLQYQINRCSGPCVDLISKEEYREDIRHAQMFLTGKNSQLIEELADAMDGASQALEFERAGSYRDQIAALKQVQSQQLVESGSANLDVVALAQEGGGVCVHLLYIRQGRILGSKSHYPREKLLDDDGAVLGAFLSQFYLQGAERDFPKLVLLSHAIEDAELLSDAIKQQYSVQLGFQSQLRGQRSKWMDMAQLAAQQNLQAQLANKQNTRQRFEALQDALALESMPERLECFDISHSSGELTVASCVVFDSNNGPLKSDYRRFNIEGITGGDDYAAMEQALRRRYTRLQKGEGLLPDVLFIDGGKGQLGRAREVLAELGVPMGPAGVVTVGVAKGTTRKAGFETLILGGNSPGLDGASPDDPLVEKVLSADEPALHLIQHIRDESHRFAITGHKNRRDKKRRTSTLEGIAGVGAKRRRELLRHFGGLQEVAKASIDDIARVPGISKKIAEDIYTALNNQ